MREELLNFRKPTVVQFVAALALLLTAVCGRAQDQMPVMGDDASAPVRVRSIPEFGVASVKIDKADGNLMSIRNTANGFVAENVSLKTLIAQAYGIKQDLIFDAPAWTETTNYDIDAKVDEQDIGVWGKLTATQKRAMLANLIKERFGLVAQKETRILPMYRLMLMGAKPKLRRDPPTGDPQAKFQPSLSFGDGEITGEHASMAAMATQLTYVLHRPVVDMTALDGEYEYTLRWVPDGEAQDSAGGDDRNRSSSVTAALSEVGLRLTADKGPVDVVVIKKIHRVESN